MPSKMRNIKVLYNIKQNRVLYDIRNKRYIIFNPGHIDDTDFHPRKGQQKIKYSHMTEVFELNIDTLEVAGIDRMHKMDIYQLLIDGFYREITKREKAKLLLKADVLL